MKPSGAIGVGLAFATAMCIVSTGLSRAADDPTKPVDYEWIKITMRAAFDPRYGAGALTFQERMWLIGGLCPKQARSKAFRRYCSNEVWSSRNGAEWRLEKPNSFRMSILDPVVDWEARSMAGYVVYHDKLWILGGNAGRKNYQSDVWNSADGKSWNLITEQAPWGQRASQYTVVHADKIWVIGGQTRPALGTSENIYHRDIWTTEDGVLWEQVQPQEPYWSGRDRIGGSAVHRGRIWMLGGAIDDSPETPPTSNRPTRRNRTKRQPRKYSSDVWSSADGVAWQEHIEAAPWVGRHDHDVAVWDDRLWVLEGYTSKDTKDVWYSADGEHWFEVPNTPWKPRQAASVFVHDGALWMVGGRNLESDVWRLQRKNAG